MSDGFEEADIRWGLREGGQVLTALIVGRHPVPGGGWNDVEYVAYLRTSWRRGYHILKTRRKLNEKIYIANGLGRLVWLLRHEFGLQAPVIIYEAGCEPLQRFVGLRPIDRGRSTEDDGPPRAAPPKPPWEWPIRHPSDDAGNKPAANEDDPEED